MRIFAAIRSYIIRWSGVAVEWEQLSENQSLIHQLCLITVPIQPLKKKHLSSQSLLIKNAVISATKALRDPDRPKNQPDEPGHCAFRLNQKNLMKKFLSFSRINPKSLDDFSLNGRSRPQQSTGFSR